MESGNSEIHETGEKGKCGLKQELQLILGPGSITFADPKQFLKRTTNIVIRADKGSPRLTHDPYDPLNT